MNILDLIQNDPAGASSAVNDALQAKVFDFLDNYVLEDEPEELSEAQRYQKETGKKYSDQTGQFVGGKNYDKLAAKKMANDLFNKPAAKNPVVPGSVKKDKDGNVLSFKTEDFEAMSQEEFDAIVEDYDQLDELSKATLGSYIKKASVDAKFKGFNAGHKEGSATARAKKPGDGMGAGMDDDDSAHKRLDNINKAVNKLINK